MYYKNLSSVAQTFYSVTFEPGDVRKVPAPINASGFVQCVGTMIPSATVEVKSEPEKVDSAETKPEVAEKPTTGRRRFKNINNNVEEE